MAEKKKRLFCEINPTCYAISVQKEICLRHLKDLKSDEKFAKTKSKDTLPYSVARFESNMIRRAPGVDLTLQENKAVNIGIAGKSINEIVINPGETFSFCRTVGKPTKRKGFKDGRIIRNNKLIPGVGGGLCNLANYIHLLVLQTPLKVTEFHTHSDALAPDEGERHPLAAGTAAGYNYIDFRFKNTTDQKIQLFVRTEGEMMYVELKSEREFPYDYELIEEGHHFAKRGEKYYRFSKIYRLVKDKKSGELLEKQLIWDNKSEVMFDYSLIPEHLIKEPLTV